MLVSHVKLKTLKEKRRINPLYRRKVRRKQCSPWSPKKCNKAGSSTIWKIQDGKKDQVRIVMTKFARRYASSQTLKTLDYLLPLSFLFALSKHSVPLFGCVQSNDHYYINTFPRERKKEKSRTKIKKKEMIPLNRRPLNCFEDDWPQAERY